MCMLSCKEELTNTRCLPACTVNPYESCLNTHKLRDVSAYCVSTNSGAILRGTILKINPHNTAVLTCCVSARPKFSLAKLAKLKIFF